MRIYLDTCCLQRPHDNQSHPRIRVETEAVFVVLAAVQHGDAALLWSEALSYEISRIPDKMRKSEVMSIAALSSEYLEITDEVEALALRLEKNGIGAMDAVHLALASTAGADFFCTSDDKLFRKAKNIKNLGCRVTTILGLIPEITK
jgi:predicted nucleic acid-binding protein